MSIALMFDRSSLVHLGLAAAALAAALLALPAGAVSLPARVAIQAHKAKPLKTLRTSNAVPSTPAALGPRSPYALAAAQRDAAGLAPPGHARVLQRSTPVPAGSTPAIAADSAPAAH